jgi:hypothetical protein
VLRIQRTYRGTGSAAASDNSINATRPAAHITSTDTSTAPAQAPRSSAPAPAPAPARPAPPHRTSTSTVPPRKPRTCNASRVFAVALLSRSERKRLARRGVLGRVFRAARVAAGGVAPSPLTHLQQRLVRQECKAADHGPSDQHLEDRRGECTYDAGEDKRHTQTQTQTHGKTNDTQSGAGGASQSWSRASIADYQCA